MVYVLDTAFGPHLMDDMLRREKAGEIVILQVYEGIIFYNRYMGAVDAADQMRTGYYSVEMRSKSKKWTNRFVDAMFNFQLTQSWAAYRFHNPCETKKGRHKFNRSICEAFLDNTFDDRTCQVTRSMEEAQREDLRNNTWGHHHHNVKMNRIDEWDRGDGFARIKPVKCVHCIEQKHTNDKRSTDCCLECKIPLHKECHADYHNLHHSNDV